MVARLAPVVLLVLSLAASSSTGAQDTTKLVVEDSVSIRLVDVDLRSAVQALARYLDRPVVFGQIQSPARVTLETPRPVPRPEVINLLRSLLESQQLQLEEDADRGVYRIRPMPTRPIAPQTEQPRQQQAGTIELFVIKMRHARAADVAATVNALYGRGGALGEIAGRPATLSQELRDARVPATPVTPAPAAVASVAGRAAALSGDVTIVPDAGGNSLLIRASRGDFELIQAAVRELDIRPLQVLIEVIIAEIRRDRSFGFGMDVQGRDIKVPGKTAETIDVDQVGLGLGDFVIRVMGIYGKDINATLRLAASRGDVSIISRPVVIAANNETAEINVGSQRPFVQVSRSLPTDTPTRDQVVQYRDVGTTLTVRPTISADGYVMLEVSQEVNAATTETQFDAPVISTRSVQTRLLVRDSQTVVLGGLTDVQRDRNQGGVPVLSAIPLLGGLFGRATRRSTDTELFLFLTPRVIRTDDEATGITQPFLQRSEQEP